MSLELRPRTEAGERTVEAAKELLSDLAARSADADESNQVTKQNFDDLIASGVSSAFVPEELGGFGLTSIHDWVLTIATLARGDASTAIAVNMHMGVSRGITLGYRSGGPGADQAADTLGKIVSGEILICATATELGTDNLHPLTEAVGQPDDSWLINGLKIFVTLSPIATHLAMNLRVRGGDDEADRLASVLLPMDTPGLIPQDDWNALGMRSSGSQSVRFEDVRVAADQIGTIGPWGEWSLAMLQNRAVANLPLVGAFLGIGEAAREVALAKLAGSTRVEQPAVENAGIQHLVGEMELELARCRAVLGAAAVEMDRYFDHHGLTGANIEAAHQLMADYQAAKWTVNRGAIDIVSKAMDLLGGSGYTTNHVLARLYRDVRAGPFMQPFGPSELRQYVGQVALGQYPAR